MLVGLLGLVGSGVAQAAPPQGVVLRIEGNEVFVDLGGATVRPGDRVVHYRTIVVTHPVSKKKIKDRFPTGEVTLLQVEPAMSMGRVSAETLKELAVGDVVILVRPEPVLPKVTPRPSPSPLASPGPAPSGSPQPSPSASPSASPGPEPVVEDPETLAVVDAWGRTLGQPPRVRRGIWQAYLEGHPQARYREAVLAELDALDALEAREVAASGREAPIGGVLHRPPSPAPPEHELELAFALEPQVGPIDAAWVHYRRAGAATYRRIELSRDGDAYLRGTLPAEAVQPGGVEYFVELARGGGTALAVGQPDDPVQLSVDGLVASRPTRRDRSRVNTRAEYVDFNRGEGNDWYWAAEADFAYRWPGLLQALRMGAGVFRGDGGPTKQIDDDEAACRASGDCRALGFNYAYTELEFRLTSRLSSMTRVIVGLTPDGLGGGLASKLRIGAEDDTNLVIGGELAHEMGRHLELGLNFEPLRKVPMMAAVEVADEPAGSDLGVRLLMDIGSRHCGPVQPTVRVSYSARTIHHSGFGAGLAAVFAW